MIKHDALLNIKGMLLGVVSPTSNITAKHNTKKLKIKTLLNKANMQLMLDHSCHLQE